VGFVYLFVSQGKLLFSFVFLSFLHLLTCIYIVWAISPHPLFVFEIGSGYVAQAGLELESSSELLPPRGFDSVDI
jgi:hypothetical protein